MVRKLDDPDAINAFLRMINATPLSTCPNARPASAPEQRVTTFGPACETTPKTSSGENTPAQDSASTSVAASPATGIRAPPSTPLAQAFSADRIAHLEPIKEDVPDILGGTAKDSPPVDYPLHSQNWDTPEKMTINSVRQPLTPKSVNFAPESKADGPMTPTQKLLLEKKAKFEVDDKGKKMREMEKDAKGYMDRVIENFRKSQATIFTHQIVENAVPFEPVNATTNGTVDTSPIVPFPSFEDTSSVGSMKLSDEKIGDDMNHVDVLASIPASLQSASLNAKQTDAEVEKEASNAWDGRARVDRTALLPNDTPLKAVGSPTIVITASTETDESTNGEEEMEARENLTHFKTWGVPAARDKPKPSVRTIILTGLPRTANNTFVQSLIHGGSIEMMKLSSPKDQTDSVNAYVTFTSGDSCSRFYDKYPNGIDVRYRGKRHTVFVNKGENVDVISGMMQAYLDCGASRVVRVTGADDDWGIVALNKLAEGKNHARIVEAVSDQYSNGTRTIIFRFASILDAVKFKGALIRDYEWEGIPVEFMEDPCEKAVGFHFD